MAELFTQSISFTSKTPGTESRDMLKIKDYQGPEVLFQTDDRFFEHLEGDVQEQLRLISSPIILTITDKVATYTGEQFSDLWTEDATRDGFVLPC